MKHLRKGTKFKAIRTGNVYVYARNYSDSPHYAWFQLVKGRTISGFDLVSPRITLIFWDMLEPFSVDDRKHAR